MRFAIRRNWAHAVAIAAATAVSLIAAGPAQASVHPAGGTSIPADHRVNATMILHVQAGSTVTVKGGGAGTSNCTADETNTTVTAASPRVVLSFGFVARSAGSCFFEDSWSNFVVTVKNNQGATVAMRTVRLRGAGAFYNVFCDVKGTTTVNLLCRWIDSSTLELFQTGTVGLKGYDVTAGLRFFVHGPGPSIHIQGGGGGTSNCTSDETNKTITAESDPTLTDFGFYAKDDGSCGREASFSYFAITISGKDSFGTPVYGTVNVYLGQQGAGDPYDLECQGSPTDNVACQHFGSKGTEALTISLVRPQP
jgi:hypothetical protein